MYLQDIILNCTKEAQKHDIKLKMKCFISDSLVPCYIVQAQRNILLLVGRNIKNKGKKMFLALVFLWGFELLS